MIKRNKKKLKIWVLIILLLPVFGYFKYKNDLQSVNPQNDSNIVFEIKKGDTVKEIAKNLEKKDLINNDLSFYIYTRFKNSGEKIIAGTFILNKSMTSPEILNTITSSSKSNGAITIQEGLRIKDIDEKLVDLKLITRGDFISAVKNFDSWEYYNFLNPEKLKKLDLPLEGYIYPDTYFVDAANFKPEDLIFKALDNFENKIEPIKNQVTDWTKTLTMASIIENEVFGQNDRKIISGILWKRLENDWPLGADATLLYITNDRKISVEDLEINSPYNTRKFKGLPPGPISNPSLDSIKAAITPQKNDYWFYLTDKNGTVIYAKTNEEHNENRRKYL